jgi:hypothetical protein
VCAFALEKIDFTIIKNKVATWHEYNFNPSTAEHGTLTGK